MLELASCGAWGPRVGPLRPEIPTLADEVSETIRFRRGTLVRPFGPEDPSTPFGFGAWEGYPSVLLGTKERILQGRLCFLEAGTQGGYPPVRTRPHPYIRSGRALTLTGTQRGTTQKECRMGNPSSKLHMPISHHLGLWLITWTKIMAQRIASG